jgi:diguanylate cyclase (GGDEF)-like protein
VALLRRRTALRPEAILAHAIVALCVVGLLCCLAASPHAYGELAFLVCVQTAMVHPARRVLLVLAVAATAIVAPLLVAGPSPARAAELAAHLVVLCALAAVAFLWASRMRALRRELREQRREAVELARVDALTGLGNRRALDEALTVQRSVVARTGRPLSLLVCDLDDFKAINDIAGHHEGDTALRCVAAVLRDTLRQPDHVFRWGGDEFVALLPDTPSEDAMAVAARVRRELPARCARPDGGRQHLSVGVAELRPGESGADLLERADALLLAAKAQGRGRRLA